jgi:hypothetical protein
VVRFRRIVRIALLSTMICVTAGASGVLATMTWQMPGDTMTAAEVTAISASRTGTHSLIMTAAHAYIDARSAQLVLQEAAAKTAAEAAARANGRASFALFDRKCLKKISKRRKAKFVHVSCAPLQDTDAQSEVIATAEAPIVQPRKVPRRSSFNTFHRQAQ